MNAIPLRSFGALLCLVCAPAAQAETAAPFSNVSVSAGLGFADLRANELVYEDGNRVSHLIWTSGVPVMTLAARSDVGGGWALTGRATIKLGANSSMTDYDWIEPYAVNYQFDNWSDRSISPDTELSRYLDLELSLGRSVKMKSGASLTLNTGLKHTETKWDSYGGSYIYSTDALHDTVGEFPDDEAGITYQQRYTSLFVGAELAKTYGAWTVSAKLNGGASLQPRDMDHHWMRDLLFVERYDVAPFVALGLRADYALNDKTGLFFSADMQRYGRKTGDTTMMTIDDPGDADTFQNGAGMDLRSATVGFGLISKF